MKTEFCDGQLHLHRTDEERSPLVKRLLRIEGQVRGLRQMIEQDRYCPDELQQANAAVAAIRAVSLLLAEQHLAASADYAARSGDEEGALHDMMNVLRAAMRR